ncbi:hypothetical protein [Branchiibius sp. NY16-3462-2]|uniref:hypothetical protein n=1 Tax=Branchiibius sp. NY16-3462-2 TaxID=1807500 RepID=UPI0007919717|nr:hypothetical protein [Branchiibius sp. NY16-3462-2]KYH43704.1 hypothetical protein AZH51_02555 [Branchiibius sp. NY16-3462-2]
MWRRDGGGTVADLAVMVVFVNRDNHACPDLDDAHERVLGHVVVGHLRHVVHRHRYGVGEHRFRAVPADVLLVGCAHR